MARASGPLSDVTVVDLSQILAGPFTTMMLADLGASVIKVERPGRGDDTRSWGPPFAGDHSSYFLSVNRGKRSIAIDLKKEDGVELVLAMCERADVVVHNFRPGVARRLGLDYTTVRARNPGLVYCSISSFGSDGPLAERAGYDALIQAMGGLMSITGDSGGSPTKVGVAIVDILAGLYALSGILAALHSRHSSGRGQHVDIALLDSLVGSLVNQAQSVLVTGEAPTRLGNAHPSIAPYQTFAASDGEFMVAVGNDGQFARLCEVVGAPGLAADPRFASNTARVENRDALIGELASRLSPRPVGEWLEALERADVPAGPVNDLAQALANPQLAHRQMLTVLRDAAGRAQRFVASPIRLSETPSAPRGFPPGLSADARGVLSDILGIDDARYAELVRAGVVAEPEPDRQGQDQ